MRETREEQAQRLMVEKTADKSSPKRYSVRMYYTYCDEYEVEAASEEEALELIDTWETQTGNAKNLPSELNCKVEQIQKNEYVDHESTNINELDADGNWIE